jgi:glycosyltransferase involved in cell wall biosynthesis
MNDAVRASVVMAAYNAEGYVELAIRSALASDLREIEVIVVDDGSNDRTPEIVSNVRDPRVVLVRLRPSGGPSRPRNVGIARARAPYVAFLDADDLIKPWKLSAAVTALDRHSEAGFAFADYERIDADGRVVMPSVMAGYPVFSTLGCVSVGDAWYVMPQTELARGLLYENFIGTSGVVLRKQLLTEIGPFDDSLVFSEDRDLWFRLSHSCGALYSSRIGHSYRITPGSLSYGPAVRNARHRITVLRREKNRWKDRTAHRQLNHLIAENLATIGYEKRRRHRRLQSIAMFAQAFTTSPEFRWLRGLLGSVVRKFPQ